MHSFKCFAAELVDTGVLCDAYEANKFTYQPGAGEHCRLMMSLEKMQHWERWKRLRDPSAVQARGFVPAPLNWNEKDDWQLEAELFSGEVMGYQVGGIWRTFTERTSEIFNFADQQLSFPSSTWIILYGNTIVWRIITCSPRDLGFLFFLQHSPENSPQNWFLTISDAPPTVPPLYFDALANQFKGRGWQPLTSTATQPPVISSGCSLCLVRGLQNRVWRLGSR